MPDPMSPFVFVSPPIILLDSPGQNQLSYPAGRDTSLSAILEPIVMNYPADPSIIENHRTAIKEILIYLVRTEESSFDPNSMPTRYLNYFEPGAQLKFLMDSMIIARNTAIHIAHKSKKLQTIPSQIEFFEDTNTRVHIMIRIVHTIGDQLYVPELQTERYRFLQSILTDIINNLQNTGELIAIGAQGSLQGSLESIFKKTVLMLNAASFNEISQQLLKTDLDTDDALSSALSFSGIQGMYYMTKFELSSGSLESALYFSELCSASLVLWEHLLKDDRQLAKLYQTAFNKSKQDFKKIKKKLNRAQSASYRLLNPHASELNYDFDPLRIKLLINIILENRKTALVKKPEKIEFSSEHIQFFNETNERLYFMLDILSELDDQFYLPELGADRGRFLLNLMADMFDNGHSLCKLLSLPHELSLKFPKETENACKAFYKLFSIIESFRDQNIQEKLENTGLSADQTLWQHIAFFGMHLTHYLVRYDIFSYKKKLAREDFAELNQLIAVWETIILEDEFQQHQKLFDQIKTEQAALKEMLEPSEKKEPKKKSDIPSESPPQGNSFFDSLNDSVAHAQMPDVDSHQRTNLLNFFKEIKDKIVALWKPNQILKIHKTYKFWFNRSDRIEIIIDLISKAHTKALNIAQQKHISVQAQSHILSFKETNIRLNFLVGVLLALGGKLYSPELKEKCRECLNMLMDDISHNFEQISYYLYDNPVFSEHTEALNAYFRGTQAIMEIISAEKVDSSLEKAIEAGSDLNTNKEITLRGIAWQNAQLKFFLSNGEMQAAFKCLEAAKQFLLDRDHTFLKIRENSEEDRDKLNTLISTQANLEFTARTYNEYITQRDAQQASPLTDKEKKLFLSLAKGGVKAPPPLPPKKQVKNKPPQTAALQSRQVQLEAECLAKKSELADLKKQAELLKNQSSETLKEFDETQVRHKQAIQALQTEKNAFKKESGSLEGQLKQITENTKQIKELRKKKADLQEQNAKLKSQHAQAQLQSSQEKTALKENLQELQSTCTSLKEKISDKTKRQSETELSVKAQEEAYKIKLEELEQEKTRHQEKLRTYAEQIQGLKQQVSTLSPQMAESIQKKEALDAHHKTKIDELAENVKRIQQEFIQLSFYQHRLCQSNSVYPPQSNPTWDPGLPPKAYDEARELEKRLIAYYHQRGPLVILRGGTTYRKVMADQLDLDLKTFGRRLRLSRLAASPFP